MTTDKNVVIEAQIAETQTEDDLIEIMKEWFDGEVAPELQRLGKMSWDEVAHLLTEFAAVYKSASEMWDVLIDPNMDGEDEEEEWLDTTDSDYPEGFLVGSLVRYEGVEAEVVAIRPGKEEGHTEIQIRRKKK